MADLVTHMCTVLLPAALFRSRWVGVAAVGAALPDLVSRLPGEALERLRAVGVPVPDWALMPWGMLHNPIPLVAVCALASVTFRVDLRARAWLSLMVGCVAHLMLDVLQDHHGHGYHLWFPVHAGDWELGWIHSEATVAFAPGLAVVTALAWAVRWGVDRGGRSGPPRDRDGSA